MNMKTYQGITDDKKQHTKKKKIYLNDQPHWLTYSILLDSG